MIKYVIYKEGDKIKGTTAENYNARMQDGLKIRIFGGFTSLQQVKKYLITWTSLKDDEIKTIEVEKE